MPAPVAWALVAALFLLFLGRSAALPQPETHAAIRASILLYHRFGPLAKDPMTVRRGTFRSQLDYLKQHGYPIIPLATLVSYLLGRGPEPPARAVIITADDGHESVFTEMLPLVPTALAVATRPAGFNVVVRSTSVPGTLSAFPTLLAATGTGPQLW